MFVKIRNSGYDRNGQQFTSGRFLMLMQSDLESSIRGIVRFTALRQVGQFMMGFARIGSHRVSLSGAYGNDGLPCTVPTDVYSCGVELPNELCEAWNKGGGWNSAGSEAKAMRQWARETFHV